MTPREISATEIDRLATKLENWPSNGKPERDDDLVVLLASGFVAEHSVNKHCRECGTPQVDYRFIKITPAGRLFMAAAKR